MTTWIDDLLGEGFTQTTLPLHDDDEGPVVATLIRYRAELDSTTPEALESHNDGLLSDAEHSGDHASQAGEFAVLAIHGWNDYFFHRDFAREIARLGGHFYALDLRKYGRSHRDGQSWGYVTNLSTYDEDIHAALDVIFAEQGYDIPLIMYGHSTGGLTAALWAHRHPGLLSGLILNSPWLEFQGSTVIRQIGQPVIDAVARMAPTTIIPVADTGNYQRLLTAWRDDDEEFDEDMVGDDPFYSTGWEPDERYRHVPSFPIRAGWIAAILRGHEQVAAGLEIDCPVLVFTSGKTLIAEAWSPDMRGADIVLDVAQIWKRVPNLGHITTLVKLEDAIHDVLLSRKQVRDDVYDHIKRWVTAFI